MDLAISDPVGPSTKSVLAGRAPSGPAGLARPALSDEVSFDIATRSAATADQAPAAHQAFERMVLGQMISLMLNAGGGGLLGEGTQGTVYAGWLADAVAGEIAERGGLGIAERLDERL